MAKFVVILHGKNEDAPSPELLRNHVRHLKRLNAEGVLFLCGPFRDNSDAMQIIEAATLEDAQSFILCDPFISENYFSDYNVHELIEANERNNFLLEDDIASSDSDQNGE